MEIFQFLATKRKAAFGLAESKNMAPASVLRAFWASFECAGFSWHFQLALPKVVCGANFGCHFWLHKLASSSQQAAANQQGRKQKVAPSSQPSPPARSLAHS